MTPTVTLYTRPGCHLCDEARATLERLQGQADFAIAEVDITTDDALHRRYLERIPVTFVDDAEHDYWRVSEDRLRAELLA